MLHALEISLKRGTLTDRLKSSALVLAPILTLSAPLSGAKAQATIDLTAIGTKPPSELLLYLDDLLERLSRKRKATILLLDEVQELSHDLNNASLIAALRTSLDKRSDRLKVVFTGSSREGLVAMFNARQAPFFHFATPLDLPPLDEKFVDHLLKVFKKTTKRKLDRDEIAAAFNQLHRNPYFFRTLIETLLLNTDNSIAETLEQVRYRIAADLGYAKTWLTLSAIQRAIAHTLADGIVKPFSEASRTILGHILDEEPPSTARVQSALRKLSKLGLADTYTGTWALDDPELAQWIRDNY